MSDRPELSDDGLRDFLERRATLARADDLLASVRATAAQTPQRRSRLPGFGLIRGRVAAGVAAIASLVVLAMVVALAGGSRAPDAGFVSGSASPRASTVAPGSAEPPATPVVPVAAQPVLPLTLDQLNAILLPNSSALLGRQLVITGTILWNPVLTPSRPLGPSPFSFSGPPAILEGAVPELGIAASTNVPLPARLPMTGTFAARMSDTRTLEYEGVVRLTSTGGAFLPSQLPEPASTAGGALWLVEGWIAGFDRPFPCPSLAAQPSGPQYNGCGAQSSLSDTGSQPVTGSTFRVPSDGILVQDRAYDDFAPDPQLTGAGTQPELATFLVSPVPPAPCPSGEFCAFESATRHWQIISRIDPWPAVAGNAGPSPTAAPSPVASGRASGSQVLAVTPLNVTQLNVFMAMNSQSPEGRQLVITGPIAAMPLDLGPNSGTCQYVGSEWTCPPAYLVGSEPRLGVEPIGDIGPGPWAPGGSELAGTFAATLHGHTLDYQGPVATTASGDAWLPGQLPSPSGSGVVGSYWLVHGWIASPPIDPACAPQPTPYPGPQYTCGSQTTLSDSAYDAQTYVAAGDLPRTFRMQNGAYEQFAPDPASTAGQNPEEATFLLQGVAVPACGPTQDCAIPPANYHWAIAARIGPWPVPNVNPPPYSCQADNIKVSIGGWGPAGGSTFVQVQLGLVTGAPCFLPETPGVAILDATGQTLVSAPPVGTNSVDLSGVLQAELGWSSWCEPPPSGPLTLRLDLYNQVVEAALPDGFGASCMGVATKVFLDQGFHTP